MNRAPLVFGLALLVAAAVAAPVLAAPPKEKVRLERKQRVGLWVLVKERKRVETTVAWKAEGAGSAGAEEVEDVEREFEHRVVNEKPLIVKRVYRLSKRSKGAAKNPDVKPENTSVHGKTVIVGPEGMKIEGGAEMSKEDQDHLLTVERVVYACLPAKEVAQGDDWQVSGPELCRAIFGPMADNTNFDTQGIGRLEKLTTTKEGKTAKIGLKISIKVKPTETLPAIDVELKGTGQFSVEDGVFTALDLDGPVRYEVVKKGGKETAKSEGHQRFVYRAEVLMNERGAPREEASAPVAKDGTLATSKKLACKSGHKFDVGFPFCGLCGAKNDEATKLCPKGCPFILRRCPLCGEACAPAE